MHALWPRLTLLPPLPFLVLAALSALGHRLRWEHVALAVVTTALAYGNPSTKRILIGLYPAALVALLYDVMGHAKNVGVSPSTVHVCDLRNLELALFGVAAGGSHLTPGEWLQVHSTFALDALCAFPYATFLVFVVACAVYLYFRDFSAMQRFTWSFFALNMLGFATYHLFPAAPPWYFHAYGCGVDVTVGASTGPNLGRVDAVLGLPFFAGMYARSSSVFGAVPSLHAAYPLLITLSGWKYFGWPLRLASLGFLGLMCFSAVYLDHHWVIDVLAGLAYCLLVVGAGALIGALRRPSAAGA